MNIRNAHRTASHYRENWILVSLLGPPIPLHWIPAGPTTGGLPALDEAAEEQDED